MDRSTRDDPPRIDESIDPIRAAISIVADGIASSVTVHVPKPSQVMPAARQLARAAGVAVELVERPERLAPLADARESA